MSSPKVEPEVRVSTLVGDRVCIRCGFNLSGQPVMKEHVYGMLIVRCPECSTVASLQEYPLLGRWAGRWAALLAGIWLIVLIGFMFASAGALFGFSQGHVETGGMKFATFLAGKHAAWLETADDPTRQTMTQWNAGRTGAASPDSWLDAKWWGKQDRWALVKEAGGIRSAIDWRAFGLVFWMVVAAVSIGMGWSVVLLNLRRTRLVVFALIPVAIALVFTYLANSTPTITRRWGPGGAVYAMDVTREILWPWIVGFSLAIGLVSLWAGLLTGRTVVRWLARLLLPPRTVGSLGFLWIADGKKPPSSVQQAKRPVA